MGFSAEALTSGLGDGAGIGGNTIKYAAGIIGGIGIALKSFAIIPEGSVGVKTRFGKARRYKKGENAGQPIIKGPGAQPTFPGVHAYKLINIRHRSSDLEPSGVDIVTEQGNQEKRNLRASITWRVPNEGDAPYKALFEVEDDNLVQMVTNVCLGGLRQTIENGDPDTINNNEELFEGTKRHTGEWLGRIGVALEAVQIKDSTPSEAQVLAHALQEPTPNGPEGYVGPHQAHATIAAVHLATEEDIA